MFCGDDGPAAALSNDHLDALLDTIRVLGEFDSPNDALVAIEAVQPFVLVFLKST
jgi:hypothetical protein